LCFVDGVYEIGCSPCLPTERIGWKFFHGLLWYLC